LHVTELKQNRTERNPLGKRETWTWTNLEMFVNMLHRCVMREDQQDLATTEMELVSILLNDLFVHSLFHNCLWECYMEVISYRYRINYVNVAYRRQAEIANCLWICLLELEKSKCLCKCYIEASHRDSKLFMRMFTSKRGI
jgi:hypothetical protein